PGRGGWRGATAACLRPCPCRPKYPAYPPWRALPSIAARSLRSRRSLVHAGMTAALFAAGMIVWRFSCYGHVVNMAFAQARAGDAHELRPLMKFLDGAAAGIAHRGAQSAD